MSQYRRGRRVEWAIRRELEEFDGVVLVVRSAGSKGVADLVVFLPEHTLLVQCKTFGVPDVHERHRLASVAYACNRYVDPVVAWREKGVNYYAAIKDEKGSVGPAQVAEEFMWRYLGAQAKKRRRKTSRQT